MLRRGALLVVTLLVAAAPAAAREHVLTGTDAEGHAARLVVDAHLHPVSARLLFKPRCPSPDRTELDLTRLDLRLTDERLEDGVLHRHWSGSHLHPQNGTAFGPMVVHVSRHADGSVHAEGGASFESAAMIGSSHHHKLCLFSVRFVVKEAPG